MNYAAHYDRLITRARGRVLTGYHERHHVVPRCMGGTDEPENIVALTGEEHYVAHQLLVRMHQGHIGLAYAAIKMAWQATGNKPYGWLRRRFSQGMHGTKRRLGKLHSAESRAKMSSARKGTKFPNRKRGIIFTPEHLAKLSAGQRGRKHTPESVEKTAAAHRGKPKSAEHRAKLSVARRRRITSLETRAKMSATRTGVQLGPMSPELRAKLSAATRAWWASGKGRNQWTTRS